MKKLFHYISCIDLFAFLSVFLAIPALSQPAVTTTTPAANSRSAPRNGAVTVNFSQPLAAGSEGAVKVFGAQRGGLRTGHSGTSATNGNAVTFSPTFGFRPGETVQVSVTPAAQSDGKALVTPRVYQFTAAATGGNR